MIIFDKIGLMILITLSFLGLLTIEYDLSIPEELVIIGYLTLVIIVILKLFSKLKITKWLNQKI